MTDHTPDYTAKHALRLLLLLDLPVFVALVFIQFGSLASSRAVVFIGSLSALAATPAQVGAVIYSWREGRSSSMRKGMIPQLVRWHFLLSGALLLFFVPLFVEAAASILGARA
jgi:hypothetical protein